MRNNKRRRLAIWPSLAVGILCAFVSSVSALDPNIERLLRQYQEEEAEAYRYVFESLNLLQYWLVLIAPHEAPMESVARQHAPDEIANQFRGLVSSGEADERFRQCQSRLSDGWTRLKTINELHEKLDRQQEQLRLAIAAEAAAKSELRDAINYWMKSEDEEIKALFDRDIPRLRTAYATKKENRDRLERQTESARKAIEVVEIPFRDLVAPALGDLNAPPLSVKEKPGDALTLLSFHCARLKIWVKYLREKERIEKARTAAIAGSGARPPADTANEGPPPDEAAPAQNQPPGIVLKLSGKVDQQPALAANGKATLESGDITLSFVPEPDAAPPGGRVEMSRSTTLTYVFDYKHAPPNELVDRQFSTCQLTATRFVMSPAGQVFPGLVGGYVCDVEVSRTGQPTIRSHVTGALRLDRRLDSRTRVEGWYLTFVGGPQYAEWKLQ